MSCNHNARFGAEVVHISVGPDQEGFTVHQNVLIDVVGDGVFPAHLSKEQPKTFQAFMVWLYAAYTCATHLALPPESGTVALLELYAFAYQFLIHNLQDAIVSVLHEKFARDSYLWLTLGSDKLALETFLRVIPSESHLYRLVVRSLAYSVEKVMDSVPSELCGPILKEVLLLKTLGAWRQGFDNTVGYKMKFLRRYEDLGSAGSSASGW
ncbi:hypothetical protein INS49_011641 [Diaporthe citri]|uniref:uncharacterized protein n=1 Tax=Diaporthe citri TaxID=83186 RepID=UPI001C80C9E5|nr:uncharacterized protein INS49_011641 [Diaporthe citri]KAG6360579.1 hypothetical protein INS49_011641 [Diaporthe citri]